MMGKSLLNDIVYVVGVIVLFQAVWWAVFSNTAPSPKAGEDEEMSNNLLRFMKVYIVILASILIQAQWLSLIDRGNPLVKDMTFADKYLYYIGRVIHAFF